MKEGRGPGRFRSLVSSWRTLPELPRNRGGFIGGLAGISPGAGILSGGETRNGSGDAVRVVNGPTRQGLLDERVASGSDVDPRQFGLQPKIPDLVPEAGGRLEQSAKRRGGRCASRHHWPDRAGIPSGLGSDLSSQSRSDRKLRFRYLGADARRNTDRICRRQVDCARYCEARHGVARRPTDTHR